MSIIALLSPVIQAWPSWYLTLKFRAVAYFTTLTCKHRGLCFDVNGNHGSERGTSTSLEIAFFTRVPKFSDFGQNLADIHG